MIETLFVDYDDTLHDSDFKFINRFKPLADEFGLTGKELWDIYLLKVHRGMVHRRFPEKHDDLEFHCKLIFQYLNKPFDIRLAKQMIKSYEIAERECWENPTFFPDTFKFLNRVVGEYKVCLTTTKHGIEKSLSLEKRGKRKYFDHVFEENTVGHRKLGPNYYEKVLELSGSSPERALSIGNSLSSDVLPAMRVGIKAIWVNRRGEPHPPNFEPVQEVRDLLEVLNYLEKN